MNPEYNLTEMTKGPWMYKRVKVKSEDGVGDVFVFGPNHCKPEVGVITDEGVVKVVCATLNGAGEGEKERKRLVEANRRLRETLNALDVQEGLGPK